jgi:hypothetical protein
MLPESQGWLDPLDMFSVYSFNFELKPEILLSNANVSKIAQTDKCSGHVDTHTNIPFV